MGATDVAEGNFNLTISEQVSVSKKKDKICKISRAAKKATLHKELELANRGYNGL